MIFIHSLYLLFILISITAMVSYPFKWGSKVYSNVTKHNYGMFGRIMF